MFRARTVSTRGRVSVVEEVDDIGERIGRAGVSPSRCGCDETSESIDGEANGAWRGAGGGGVACMGRDRAVCVIS